MSSQKPAASAAAGAAAGSSVLTIGGAGVTGSHYNAGAPATGACQTGNPSFTEGEAPIPGEGSGSSASASGVSFGHPLSQPQLGPGASAGSSSSSSSSSSSFYTADTGSSGSGGGGGDGGASGPSSWSDDARDASVPPSLLFPAGFEGAFSPGTLEWVRTGRQPQQSYQQQHGRQLSGGGGGTERHHARTYRSPLPRTPTEPFLSEGMRGEAHATTATRAAAVTAPLPTGAGGGGGGSAAAGGSVQEPHQLQPPHRHGHRYIH